MPNNTLISTRGHKVLLCLFGINLAFATIIIFVPSHLLISTICRGDGVIASPFVNFLKSRWVADYILWFALFSALAFILSFFMKSIQVPTIEKLDHPVFFAILSAFAVLFYDGQFIGGGSFYHDDFTFLCVTTNGGLLDQILVPHGAVVPIQRFVFWFISSLSGHSPAGYNLYVLVIFALSLFSTTYLLRVYNVSFLGRVAFVVFVSGWTFWGMTTGGFITANIFYTFQIMPFFILGTLLGLKWARRGTWWMLVASIGCFLFTIGLYHSGLWTIPAAILIVFEKLFGSGWRDVDVAVKRRALTYLLVIPVAGFSTRVLWSWILGENNVVPIHTLPTIDVAYYAHATFFLLIHGVINSLFYPGMMAHHVAPEFGLEFLLYIPVVLIALFLLLTFLSASRGQRTALASLLGILLLVTAMHPIGRPYPSAYTFIWITIVQFPFFWFAILLIVSMSFFLANCSPERRDVPVAVCFYLLFMYVSLQGFASTGSLNKSRAFGSTRGYALRRAAKTNQEIQKLAREVEKILQALPKSNDTPVTLPNLHLAKNQFKYLSRFSYGISTYRAFYSEDARRRIRFVSPTDTPNPPEAFKQFGYLFVEDPLVHIDPEFFDLAKESAFWRDLLSATPWIHPPED